MRWWSKQCIAALRSLVTHFFPVEVDTSVDMEEETKD